MVPSKVLKFIFQISNISLQLIYKGKILQRTESKTEIPLAMQRPIMLYENYSVKIS
jgi:hypothetical protein